MNVTTMTAMVLREGTVTEGHSQVITLTYGGEGEGWSDVSEFMEADKAEGQI